MKRAFTCLLGLLLCNIVFARDDCLAGRRLIAFGDSWSAAPPGLLEWNTGANRYTNGKIWLEYLRDSLGLDIISYAEGGATLDGSTTLNDTFTGQIYNYLQSNTPQASDCFAFWIGANDVIEDQKDIQTLLPLAEQKLAELKAKGAKCFFIFTYPLVERFAFHQLLASNSATAAAAAILSNVVVAANAAVASAVTTLNASAAPGETYSVINAEAAFSAAETALTFVNDDRADPTDAMCLLPNSFLPSCVNTASNLPYFLVDDRHPTTKVHELLANNFIQQMCSAPVFTTSTCSSSLSDFDFGSVDYIASLTEDKRLTLFSGVSNESNTEAGCETSSGNAVYLVKVTPGKSWIVKLLKGFGLKVTGWGSLATTLYALFMDYATTDSSFTELGITKPKDLPTTAVLLFLFNIDRVSLTGAMLNNDTMEMEIEISEVVNWIYIYSGTGEGKLLEKDGGKAERRGKFLIIKLSHTSTIAGFGTTPDTGGSNAGLYGLFALFALPVVALIIIGGYFWMERKEEALEPQQQVQQPPQVLYYIPSTGAVVPPPTPVSYGPVPYVVVG